MGKENIHLLRKMQLEEMTKVICGIAERDLKWPNSEEALRAQCTDQNEGLKNEDSFVSVVTQLKCILGPKRLCDPLVQYVTVRL